jgi:hypothetical protein
VESVENTVTLSPPFASLGMENALKAYGCRWQTAWADAFGTA